MSVWLKLVTAVRGGANEAAEAVADNQAVRIFEQEMRDADRELRKSEESLTTIIAKQKMGSQKVAALDKSISEHEGYVAQTLEKSDEGLALEIASKIADLTTQRDTEQQFLSQFEQSSTQLRKSVSEAKSNIRRMKQQLDTIKATEAVQKAQTAVSTRHLGANSKMKTAAESLERIKAKQQLRQAELEAANELADDETDVGLQSRLKAAGITPGESSAQDILAKIKSQQAG